jgi:type II secretory pathway pseudopilin PulG
MSQQRQPEPRARELRRRLSDERGYLMVALLVAMSIMAIMMGAALPAWRTLAQREKEAELIFRGEQYARAIGLFQRRYGNATPPDLDVLINQRFLRKKYKDPITNSDFQLVSPGTALPGMPGPPQPQTPGTANPSAGRGRGIDLSPSGGRQGEAGRGEVSVGRAGGVGAGGIVGVVSKSSERSFRLYNGRDTYNQWVFMAIQQSNRAGGPGGAPPGVGPRGGGTGGRGPNAPPGGFGGSGGFGGGRDGRGGRGDQGPGRGFPPPAGRGGQPQNPGQRGRGF